LIGWHLGELSLNKAIRNTPFSPKRSQAVLTGKKGYVWATCI
jgi:hypothetical protein